VARGPRGISFERRIDGTRYFVKVAADRELTIESTGPHAQRFRAASDGLSLLVLLSPEPPRAPDLAAAALLYHGCPYLWGGRSFLGLDCSGLVQEAFRDLDIAVPRDTDMQRDAIGTTVVPDGIPDLRRDDLIFIPGHVMIYAGNGDVVHAYGGGMKVQRDRLSALMQAQDWSFADLAVRRLSGGAVVKRGGG
jgi:cell wall-associated NlpC family hydrolase